MARDSVLCVIGPVQWTLLPGGMCGCPVHPDQPPFAPHVGCQLPHEIGPEQDSPGEGELLVAEAESRGLPDGMTVEAWSWKAFKAARAEATKCRELATLCEDRARRFVAPRDDESLLAAMTRDRDGELVEADSEDQARRWFDLAAKFRQSVAKAIDTQSKLLKLGAGNVQVRERMAQRDRIARHPAVKGRGN